LHPSIFNFLVDENFVNLCQHGEESEDVSNLGDHVDETALNFHIWNLDSKEVETPRQGVEF
jgi:hypothetical protein